MHYLAVKIVKYFFMGNKLLLAFICATFLSLSANTVEIIDFKQYQQRTQQKNDTLYIVNFWATWCKPCIEELPYFEEAQRKFAGKKVKILLVSLDFRSDHARVEKFVTKKNLHNTVLLLDGGNPNVWIDKVDPKWSGAIPATVLYKAGKKVYFKEGQLTSSELESLIQTKIK